MMAVAPMMRAIMLTVADYPATYVFTLCRFDALAAGAVVAVLFGNHKWQAETARLCKILAPFVSVVIVTTFLVPFSPSLPETRPWLFSIFGYSWLAICFAILLGASLDARGPIRAVLTSPLLMFLGRRCYGLYLWHVLVASMVTTALQPFQVGFYGHVMLWLIALLVVAGGSWVLLEEPVLRLKHFIPYEKKLKAKFEFKLTQVQ